MINYQASSKDMTSEEIKEANRFMWAVKGMLIPLGYSRDDVNATFKSYFKRLWCNCHDYQLEGFDEAWELGKKERLEKWGETK